MTPFGDGTGPLGQGPVGKGLGPCGGGQRRGRGRGDRGYGKGFGWGQRQGEQVQPPPPAPDTSKESKPSLQSELTALQQRVRQLETTMAAKTSSPSSGPAPA